MRCYWPDCTCKRDCHRVDEEASWWPVALILVAAAFLVAGKIYFG